MANNENNTESPNESDLPQDSSRPLPDDDQELAPGLTADEAADRAYDEADVWNKNKNGLFALFGIIALAVAGYNFFLNRDEGQASERSSAFLRASLEEDGAEERFLSFAKDHDDKLGGVAKHGPQLFNTGPRSSLTLRLISRKPPRCWRRIPCLAEP